MQSSTQLLFSFPRQCLLLRISGVYCPQGRLQWPPILTVQRIQGYRRVPASPAPPTPTVTRLVNCDPVDPSAQVGITPEAGNVLKSPQKGFLRQVARLFSTFGQPVEEAVDLTGTVRDQLIECCRFAALQSFNELSLGKPSRLVWGCQSNLLQIHLPAEGNGLSVAHWFTPSGRNRNNFEPLPFPDSPPIRHHWICICSREIFRTLDLLF